MNIQSLKEKNVIEAALYLYDRPLSFNELAELIQKNKEEVEKYIEELRDEHLDQKTAYHIVETEDGVFQLKLRDEVTARLQWPFVKRSEVPLNLLKVLSLIAFKEYVLEEEVTPNKLVKLLGQKANQEINELNAMSLVTITPKGKKKILNVTEEFLILFKLPNERKHIKTAIQAGLREYALRQLQFE